MPTTPLRDLYDRYFCRNSTERIQEEFERENRRSRLMEKEERIRRCNYKLDEINSQLTKGEIYLSDLDEKTVNRLRNILGDY